MKPSLMLYLCVCVCVCVCVIQNLSTPPTTHTQFQIRRSDIIHVAKDYVAVLKCNHLNIVSLD